MTFVQGHKHTHSQSQNQKANLASAYAELGKELSSTKVRVVGNYTLGKVIGEGTYGKVRLGTHRLTSTRVAIKQIPKDVSASLTREIHHHRQLHHPHICQLYEVIATESSIWLVTELCSGGELFDYLAEQRRLPEEETRKLFGQLCLAVGYAHERGVVHRDLKLENVLLDERCRVKLGDFGFTREFDPNSMLETFCGTTGYASPEMLQGKKYIGPETDVWSLGVILYTLLVGSLPFDDDEERVMQQLIIKGEYADPEWLSEDVRDLIAQILQIDSSKRPSVKEILGHRWFRFLPRSHPLLAPAHIVPSPSPPRPDHHIDRTTFDVLCAKTSSPLAMDEFPHVSSDSATSDTDNTTTSHTFSTSATSSLRTSDDVGGGNELKVEQETTLLRHNPSEATIRYDTRATAQVDVPSPLVEELPLPSSSGHLRTRTDSLRSASPSVGGGAEPPLPSRTPVRTKRRSIPIALSPPLSPTQPILAPPPPPPPQEDFLTLFTQPSPLVFSTPLERELLEDLSKMGFDTAQMCHSVMNDACDASGAVWWILLSKRKTMVEKGLLPAPKFSEDVAHPSSHHVGGGAEKGKHREKVKERDLQRHITSSPRRKRSPEPLDLAEVSSRLSSSISLTHSGEREREKGRERKAPPSHLLDSSKSAPQLSLVPATPTFPEEAPPLASSSGNKLPYLVSSPVSTPGSSSGGGEKELGLAGLGVGKDQRERKGSKPRSGSVSMLQRATTALEAAASGLVRKKSTEAVPKEKDKEREKEKEKDKEKEKKEKGSLESNQNTGSSVSLHRLTKSPPATVRELTSMPSTPERHHPSGPSSNIGSPWAFAGTPTPHGTPSNSTAAFGALTSTPKAKSASAGGDGSPTSTAQGLSTSPADTLSALPQLGTKKRVGGTRNRASLLLAFKSWFGPGGGSGSDKKAGGIGGGKKKRVVTPSPTTSYAQGSSKRGRGGSNHNRPNRASMSSRRSSSVNSRRSSGASVHRTGGSVALDSPSPTRQIGMIGLQRSRSDASKQSRGGGSHTPLSDRGEFSSRPSSIRSFSYSSTAGLPPSSYTKQQQRSGSPHSAEFTSPLQRFHHRRGSNESGSTTTVLRQYQRHGMHHKRTGSSASSVHSPASSRRTSWYGNELEGAAGENSGGTPVRPTTPRNNSSTSEERTPRRMGSSGPPLIVAHKKTSALSGPSLRPGSSWKRSWGVEPPGWSSRSTHLPVEISILASDGLHGGSSTIRDVFSNLGKLPDEDEDDESEWEDMEDVTQQMFLGGVGQVTASSSKRGKKKGTLYQQLGMGNTSTPTRFNRDTPLHGQDPKRNANNNARNTKRGGGPGIGLTPITSSVSASTSRQQRGGGSPISPTMALPEVGPQPGGGRRQMPANATSNTLRQVPIQEEEEEEEE